MKIKYPKFTLMIFTFILAYLMLASNQLVFLRGVIESSGIVGSFLAGSLFTYGFTTAPATAMFLIMSKSQNILLTAMIGGVGSLVGDFIIFKLIRNSFTGEVKKLCHEKLVKEANHAIPKKVKHYITPALAGLIIASPFPDEIAVCMLASDKRITKKRFAVISYVFNTLGILAILLAGSAA